MRSAIAVIMAILGTILVLSGTSAMWASVLSRTRSDGPEAVTPISRSGRMFAALSQLPAPDRMIIWGVVLLALSALAAGAITFSVEASAGTG